MEMDERTRREGKREDSFHDLETVFYPVALNEIIEIITTKSEKEPVIFSHSGSFSAQVSYDRSIFVEL